MTKARTLESRGNVSTLFTGCAQIYHQRWYVRSPRGKLHLHGSPHRFALRRTVRQRQAHMGELQSPIGAKEPPLPPSVLCVRAKAKGQPLPAHKVYVCAPLPCRQNVGVVYG